MVARANAGNNPSFNRGDVVYLPDAPVTPGSFLETRKASVAGAAQPSGDGFTVPVIKWDYVDRQPDTGTRPVNVPVSMLFSAARVAQVVQEAHGPLAHDNRSPDVLAADPAVSEQVAFYLLGAACLRTEELTPA